MLKSAIGFGAIVVASANQHGTLDISQIGFTQSKVSRTFSGDYQDSEILTDAVKTIQNKTDFDANDFLKFIAQQSRTQNRLKNELDSELDDSPANLQAHRLQLNNQIALVKQEIENLAISVNRHIPKKWSSNDIKKKFKPLKKIWEDLVNQLDYLETFGKSTRDEKYHELQKIYYYLSQVNWTDLHHAEERGFLPKERETALASALQLLQTSRSAAQQMMLNRRLNGFINTPSIRLALAKDLENKKAFADSDNCHEDTILGIFDPCQLKKGPQYQKRLGFLKMLHNPENFNRFFTVDHRLLCTRHKAAYDLAKVLSLGGTRGSAVGTADTTLLHRLKSAPVNILTDEEVIAEHGFKLTNGDSGNSIAVPPANINNDEGWSIVFRGWPMHNSSLVTMDELSKADVEHS